MKTKFNVWILEHSPIFSFLKKCITYIVIALLVTVALYYFQFIAWPLIKICLNPLFASNTAAIKGMGPKTMFEAMLNGANFAIAYISLLLAITAILVGYLIFWWGRKLDILRECNRDYEIFKQNAALQAPLITAKIFVIDERYSEAWEEIEDLRENFSYEVPLYKARILMGQKHGDYVFPVVMKLLNKALLFPGITTEIKSIIFREISRAYLQEKKDYGKALEYAEMAIKENYTHWSAYNAKALALRHLGNLDDAIKILEECIKGNNKYDVACYNLACYYTLKMEGETEANRILNFKNEAISKYQRAITLQPKNKDYSKTDRDLRSIWEDIKDLQP